jgi:hypothetical protein
VENPSSIFVIFRHKRFPSFRLKERLMRIRVRRLVKHEGFFWAVVIIVLLNTVSLATEHYNQQEWMTEFQGWFLMIPYLIRGGGGGRWGEYQPKINCLE